MLERRDLGTLETLNYRWAELFQRLKQLQEQSGFLTAEIVYEFLISSEHCGQINGCYLIKAKFTLGFPKSCPNGVFTLLLPVLTWDYRAAEMLQEIRHTGEKNHHSEVDEAFPVWELILPHWASTNSCQVRVIFITLIHSMITEMTPAISVREPGGLNFMWFSQELYADLNLLR